VIGSRHPESSPPRRSGPFASPAFSENSFGETPRTRPSRSGWGVVAALIVLAPWATGCDRRSTSTETGAAGQGSRVASVTPAKVTFNAHIQPILAENCYHCHGPDSGSRKAELRLDRAEYAFAPHPKRGPAIVAGAPDKSPLVTRIESTDEKERMPPPEAHKTLTPEELALLRRWVQEGAEYEEHWAFIAPRRPAPPSTGLPPGGRNPIDAFIRASLAGTGLTPAPEADRTSLIRRVTFDLTGLPPTPEEVRAFIADTAPGAYERVVDRLLASPRYGEHRARYWLDYVRYADTHGLHFDNVRAIWPYRDYVISAFNRNVPFDQFMREQLAGDLLPARTVDEVVATGMLRCNLTTNEGGTITEEIFVNQTRDRVESFGVAFLGLTTGCAACHDHKFDPVTQKDFYSLAAFLGNTVEKPWDLNAPDPVPVLRVPAPAQRAAVEAELARRAAVQERHDARRASARDLMAAWLASGQRPRTVAADALELRLRLDEGKGETLRNHATGAAPATFVADTNPLVWGENSWAWPAMRMDIASRVPLGTVGDIDTTDAFSAGGWMMLRQKTGGGGTGNGSLLARRGDDRRLSGRGWDLYQRDLKLELNLVHTTGEHAIQLVSKEKIARYEWVHLFFTYDGSGRAAGLKLFINGRLADTEVKLDTLQPGQSVRTDAVTHLGRRDDAEPQRETSYQDVRVYRRALAADEVARLPFEDLAAEIVARQPDPRQWTTDEAFIAADRFFFGEIDREGRELARELAAADAAVEALTRKGPATLVIREKPTPAYSDVLKRGDYFARVERVEPGVPHFLPPLPAGAPRNRKGLADWLLAPEQPLFARVTVNRMWQEVFGTGLVDSTGDFGVMGSKPSHPALLDWLAVEFRESGWDTRKFYRLLVTSATYRQDARVTPEHLTRDPANRLLARGPRFRMDGETLRDAALAVSGLLVERVGGPPVKPYQPAGMWEEVAMPEANTKIYEPGTGEDLYRRSIYTFWKRASPPPSMETFDSPSRELVCVKRPRSNTPLQAFVTLNDVQWVEAARKLAERALHGASDEKARFAFLATTTLGRAPSEREQRVLAASLQRFSTHFRADRNAAILLTGVGEASSDPRLDVSELASWTLVASQLLNLDEFLTK
jgi:mono/diheme cytochrome c family protein